MFGGSAVLYRFETEAQYRFYELTVITLRAFYVKVSQ